jgi:hypothetical protein
MILDLNIEEARRARRHLTFAPDQGASAVVCIILLE